MIWNASQAEVAYQQFADNQTNADAQRAYENKRRSCSPLPSPARSKCEAEIEYATHEAEHDDRDLEAQRTTAVWTRYLGIAGIVGTAFGLLGVLLVLLTFRENKRAADAAVVDQRPWLQVKLEPETVSSNAKQVSILYRAYVINIGKTLAREIEFEGAFVCFGPDADSEIDAFFSKPFTRHNPFSLRRTLLPGGETTYRTAANRPLSKMREVRDWEGTLETFPIIVINVRYRWGAEDAEGRTSLSWQLSNDQHGAFKVGPECPRYEQGISAHGAQYSRIE